MDRIGRELLADAKSFLHASGEKGTSWRARDLLSLLVRANTDDDLPESQRMSDTDVLARTSLSCGILYQLRDCHRGSDLLVGWARNYEVRVVLWYLLSLDAFAALRRPGLCMH